jgi:hypothetical protein
MFSFSTSSSGARFPPCPNKSPLPDNPHPLSPAPVQLLNKKRAMALLKARLLVLAQERQLADVAQIRGDVVKAEWGQQVRNYVFHPYRLVKDARTGVESTDVDAIMDGDLDRFMQQWLRWRASGISGEGAEGAEWTTTGWISIINEQAECEYDWRVLQWVSRNHK